MSDVFDDAWEMGRSSGRPDVDAIGPEAALVKAKEMLASDDYDDREKTFYITALFNESPNNFALDHATGDDRKALKLLFGKSMSIDFASCGSYQSYARNTVDWIRRSVESMPI